MNTGNTEDLGGGGSETSIGCICHYTFFSKLIGGPHQE